MDSNPAGLAALSEEYTLGEHPTHRGMTLGRQSKEAATCKLSRLRRNQLCLRLDLGPPASKATKNQTPSVGASCTIARGSFQRWESRAAQRPARPTGALPASAGLGESGRPIRSRRRGERNNRQTYHKQKAALVTHAATVSSGAERGAVLWNRTREGGSRSHGGDWLPIRAPGRAPRQGLLAACSKAGLPPSALLTTLLHP